MENALTFPTLFDERLLYDSNDIKRGLESLKHYKRLGLKEQIERAKEGIVAAILATKDMALLGIHLKCYDGDVKLFKINADGNRNKIDGLWKCSILKDFKGIIPLEILEKIPTDAPSEAWVFKKQVDPILAYEIKPATQINLIKERNIFKSTFYQPVCVESYPLYAAIFRWE